MCALLWPDTGEEPLCAETLSGFHCFLQSLRCIKHSSSSWHGQLAVVPRDRRKCVLIDFTVHCAAADYPREQNFWCWKSSGGNRAMAAVCGWEEVKYLKGSWTGLLYCCLRSTYNVRLVFAFKNIKMNK